MTLIDLTFINFIYKVNITQNTLLFISNGVEGLIYSITTQDVKELKGVKLTETRSKPPSLETLRTLCLNVLVFACRKLVHSPTAPLPTQVVHQRTVIKRGQRGKSQFRSYNSSYKVWSLTKFW